MDEKLIYILMPKLIISFFYVNKAMRPSSELKHIWISNKNLQFFMSTWKLSVQESTENNANDLTRQLGALQAMSGFTSF